jgi:alkylated DNA repair dioxygenase AlkB
VAARALRGAHGAPPGELAQILLTRYPPGAGIGWHLDAPMFGPIAGVSLGAPCRMRFRRAADGTRETSEVAPRAPVGLPPGGEARWAWQHMIPPAQDLRHSITFRTLEPA